MLPALPRLPDIRSLIDSREYFTLHAPRQSGKTTVIKAYVNSLNKEGSYYALFCSLAPLIENSDGAEAMSTIVSCLADAILISKVNALKQTIDDTFWAELEVRHDFKESPVKLFLRSICKRLDRDLVIFFDKTDCLYMQPLSSLLTQLRDGFTERSKAPFPRSIALVGMRNIRDYEDLIWDESESIGSSSPFNIITEALTLPDFTESDVKALYGQHTEATGQVFEDEAVQRAFYWSEGQPWLVNAMDQHVVEKILS
jgi:hypothetical protein